MANASYGLGFHAFFGAALTTSDSAISDLVPSVFPVSFDGNPYDLDWANPSGGNFFRRDSIALLRTQADNARSAGESSVSPELFWRRSLDSWHLGAGQTHADREVSSPYRFRSSKGMDVWTVGELNTLNGVSQDGTISAGSNLRCVVAGSRLYAVSGDTTKYTTGGSGSWSWTSVTGTPANAPVGIASDGKNVWIAHTDAIYATTNSSTSASSLTSAPATTTWTGIWFNKGKLFASASDSIMYEITAGGTAVAVVDRSTLGFTWSASAGVGGFHYFAGYSGDKSLIFKADLTDTATALSPAVVAGELPDGEIVYHLGSYLGYLIVGTSKGVRFCTNDQYGYVTVGGLIETGQPVYDSEGQDRFVWFGWGNYDSVSSGLGRMDLSQFTSTLTPAYASDLMATTQGATLSVVTFNDKRVFTVSGVGLFVETTTAVSSASLDSGLISHGIIDRKVASFIDARLESLASGSVISLGLAVDSGDFDTHGVTSIDGAKNTEEFFIGSEGRNFEIRISFTNAVTCTGVLLRSYPAPTRSTKFSVPVKLFDTVDVADQDWHGNPALDFSFLSNLHKKQLPFIYKEGDVSYTVVMDDYTWLPEKRSAISGFQGTFVAQLREIL